MRKIILTVEIEEAEAVKKTIESMPISMPASERVRRVLSFNMKLSKCIQRAKEVKDGKSQ